jgi:microcystin-dependent protein
MSDPYLSEIRIFAFNSTPRGWVQCNGQTMSLQSSQALFALLGTTYGGNGVQTFQLPNLQGRVPLHYGPGEAQTITLGEIGGVVSHTLTVAEIPSHNHTVNASSGAQTAFATAGVSVPGSGNLNAYGSTASTALNPAVIGSNGSSQAHPNMQPYLVLNFCIATTGLFPSRN